MKDIDKLHAENITMRTLLRDIMFMARRYADNRMSYAGSTVNNAIDTCLELGIKIEPDVDIGMYCRDGMFGTWNPEAGTWNHDKPKGEHLG